MEQETKARVRAAYVGCVLTGVASLIGALFPFFAGEFLPSGLFMVAASLSFGLLALALMKE